MYTRLAYNTHRPFMHIFNSSLALLAQKQVCIVLRKAAAAAPTQPTNE